jgi:3-methyladenine DNA glycosylase AlkC
MAEPFKNLFNLTLISEMATHLKRQHKKFASDHFIADASRNLASLELKQRSAQITDALETHLPGDFLAAKDLLVRSLHPEENAALGSLDMNAQGIRGWAVMPMAEFIARRGLPYFGDAMQALEEMTKRFSAEFAVRTLINHDLKAALVFGKKWSRSPNFHVRRLASEGFRPRLPWGQHIPALIFDPQPALPILLNLRDDPSEYVRRSVANHLNDIAKDHPEWVVNITREWMPKAPKEREKLLKHACRTLIKQGNQDILQAFGFTSASQVSEFIEVQKFTLAPKKIVMGEDAKLHLRIKSCDPKNQSIVVDYVIYWKLANGRLSPKVYKWKNILLEPEQVLSLDKKHSFKKITTRTYYAGKHKAEVQINGVKMAEQIFDLTI